MKDLVNSFKLCCSIINHRDSDLRINREERENPILLVNKSRPNNLDTLSKESASPVPSTFYSSNNDINPNRKIKSANNFYATIPPLGSDAESYSSSLTYPQEKLITKTNPFELTTSSKISFAKLSIPSTSFSFNSYISLKSSEDSCSKPTLRIKDSGKGLFSINNRKTDDIVLHLKQSQESVCFNNPDYIFSFCKKIGGIDLSHSETVASTQDSKEQIFSIEYDYILGKYIFKPAFNSNKIRESQHDHLLYIKLTEAKQLPKGVSSYVLIGTFLIMIKQEQCERKIFSNVVTFGNDASNNFLSKKPLNTMWMLNVKIYYLAGDKPSKAEVRSYQFSEEELVTIGRSSKSTIPCVSNDISKLHLTIRFDKSKDTWTIQDGTPIKCSANGTWIVVNEGHILEEGTTSFKFGKQSFDIHGEYE